jgi:hypothetical protein
MTEPTGPLKGFRILQTINRRLVVKGVVGDRGGDREDHVEVTDCQSALNIDSIRESKLHAETHAAQTRYFQVTTQRR